MHIPKEYQTALFGHFIAGTLLGQHLGWRSTFWFITVIGVVALSGIIALVPATTPGRNDGNLRGELAALRPGRCGSRSW